MTTATQQLAILGGPKAISESNAAIVDWPIITDEDRHAMLEVIDRSAMSEWDVTQQFEREWAAYNGVEHALSYPNGTQAILGAMYAVGIGHGHEVIAPAYTFWASMAQLYSLGATPVFADVERDSLCIDPDDIEHRITPRTKAIIVVHYNGHPADMDRIMLIARKHGLAVVEDVSRAQGSRYKGRMCGSLGDAAGASMMTRKAFAVGEGGMLTTNNREALERAIAFSLPAEHADDRTIETLRDMGDVPLSGLKARLNQVAAAMGRVQLKHYPDRIAEIQRAVGRFWDLLEDVPGITPHRIAGEGSDMGGWFYPMAHYDADALGGLPASRFVEAVAAEGAIVRGGIDRPQHLSPIFNTVDIYGHGKPTRLAYTDRDLRQLAGSLPVAEAVNDRVINVPWFKRDSPEQIERQAAAYRKVARQSAQLFAG
jgi:dTDP-4-amino-4,6-dideoxygalactose transaminase